MKPKFLHFLEDSDLRRWYNNLSRGSQVTADTSLRRLGVLCQNYKKSPKDFLQMNEKEISNFLMDFVTDMEAKGYAGSYISQYIKALKSWLAHNHKELKVKIKIKGVQDTPSLKDERVPTSKELKSILLSGDRKARVACILIAHSGLRIETLGNYLGNDGLRVRDFLEMTIKDGHVEFTKIPTILVVRKELSKAGHQYFTFLSEEGCEYLKDFLEERLRLGERLGPESPIITPKVASKPFIRATNIGDIIRGAIRKAGFPWRPYVLRSYFDTQLMLAESKGLVLRDYRQFWMGHKGDIEARYTTNKQRFSEEVVEDMREAYRRCQEYLQTTKTEVTNEERLRAEFKRHLLLAAGFNQDEIAKIDLPNMSDEDFQTMIRQKLLGAMQNNGKRQKVINMDEIEEYLNKGWEFVAPLSNGRVIVKLPF